MKICLLLDGLGVARELQLEALRSWAKPSGSLAASWLVRDSGLTNPEHPGFAIFDEQALWVHQPLISELQYDGADLHRRLAALASSWVPPSESVQAENDTLVRDAVVWHVTRRWRLLSSALKGVRRKGCEWLGYFRANSVVDAEAVLAIAEDEAQEASEHQPLIFGRGISADTHGSSAPGLSWGDSVLQMVWASRGLMLNVAALQILQDKGEPLSADYVTSVAKWVLHYPKVVTAGLEGQRTGDGHVLGLVEITFAASLRGQHQALRLRQVQRPADRFVSQAPPHPGQLLERFAFRLGAASFGWAATDLEAAGLVVQQRSWRQQLRRTRWLKRRLLFRGTRFFASCLVGPGLSMGGRCDGLLPKCVISFYPVHSPAQARELSHALQRSSCIAGADLHTPRGAGVVVAQPAGRKAELRVLLKRGQLLVRVGQNGRLKRAGARRTSTWCGMLRRNRQLWADLVSIDSSKSGPRLASAAGTKEQASKPLVHWAPRASGQKKTKSTRPCPTFQFSPKHRGSRGLGPATPRLLHPDEWTHGPAGQLRLATPVTVVASLPNSGSSWILGVLRHAYQQQGCAAVNSDFLHPHCNAPLSADLSKTMGATEDQSWPNIFQPATPAALDISVFNW